MSGQSHEQEKLHVVYTLALDLVAAILSITKSVQLLSEDEKNIEKRDKILKELLEAQERVTSFIIKAEAYNKIDE